MGQKMNPLGFRLGTTQRHHSIWFEQRKCYSEGLQEDKKIRDCINNCVYKNIKIPSGVEGIAHIEIHKDIDLIRVVIYMVFPNTKAGREKKKKIIKELPINIKKQINCRNRKLKIDTPRIVNPYRHPKILAEFIAGQLKNRVSFRAAMKKAIELTQTKKRGGIRIQIAGRLNGKDIARVEKIRKGRIPLQTIRAKINYCSYIVRTIYGVLGIKIWIFGGEA
uniref:Small ribosomal subunit protein uS3c n=1 Tax=Viviania marifolia TaxID=28971 RepID=V9P8I1_VIVMA|nr:ribosomal protein S3 [Viviania marifolia]AGV02860.1 ribosomal protein S3 [Viviania marifolia]